MNITRARRESQPAVKLIGLNARLSSDPIHQRIYMYVTLGEDELREKMEGLFMGLLLDT